MDQSGKSRTDRLRGGGFWRQRGGEAFCFLRKENTREEEGSRSGLKIIPKKRFRLGEAGRIAMDRFLWRVLSKRLPEGVAAQSVF